MGRQVPIRAGVGASSPTGAGVCACGRTGGFPLAPSPLRIATRNNRAPHRVTSPSSAPESARQSPSKGNLLRQSCPLSMQAVWLSARPPAPPSGSRRTDEAWICTCGRTNGLSSGQTIGVARTAMRYPPSAHQTLAEQESAPAFQRLFSHQKRPPTPPASSLFL